MSRYLSQDVVLLLHDLALELDAGSAGVLSPAALEAALAQPMMEAFGHKRYLTLFDEAAAYWFYLSRPMPSWTATSALPSWQWCCFCI